MFRPIIDTTLVVEACSIIARASDSVEASGFSQNKYLPAWSACMAYSRLTLGGVSTYTASTHSRHDDRLS
jgi:hypothetical protein